MTRRGAFTLGAAAALFILGRVLGIQELIVLATAALALVMGAMVQVRTHRPRLEVTRQLHPPRTDAGRDTRVQLVVRNLGSRPTPVLTVRDPFHAGRREASFLLGPLAPGEVTSASYLLTADRRGVFGLGPLEVAQIDAFGLARKTKANAPATRLVVYPRVEAIAPLPPNAGRLPSVGTRPNALAHPSEDFYALRPYEIGDDVRRVHWPSTARVDELMVRKDRMPWQRQVTVLVDLRRQVHSPESLELAVSAAASIVSATWGQRSLVRLLTTGGYDSGFSSGLAHAEAILEHLATVQANGEEGWGAILAGLQLSGAGALAAVTAEAGPVGASPGELQALARLRERFANVSIVLVEASACGTPRSASDRSRKPSSQFAPVPGVRLVRVTGANPFGPAWNQALEIGATRDPRRSTARPVAGSG